MIFEYDILNLSILQNLRFLLAIALGAAHTCYTPKSPGSTPCYPIGNTKAPVSTCHHDPGSFRTTRYTHWHLIGVLGTLVTSTHRDLVILETINTCYDLYIISTSRDIGPCRSDI